MQSPSRTRRTVKLSLRSPLSLAGLSLALAVSLLAPEAGARRIIGAQPDAAEEEGEAKGEKGEKAGEKDAKPDSAEEDQKRKKAAEEKAKKAEAAAEAKRRAKEAAEEAAQKAADEAEAKKRAAAEKKKRDAEEREKARLDANRAGRLKAAKKVRLYTRADGDISIGVALEPGKADPDKVMELRLEVNKILEVAHPRYGNRQPLKGLRLIATVEEPAKGKGEGKSYRYRVQPLRAPGAYGLHHTPRLEGEHTVRIEGQSQDGKTKLSFSLPVHVGVWPPPDFDDEEVKNASETAGRASVGRRIVGGN